MHSLTVVGHRHRASVRGGGVPVFRVGGYGRRAGLSVVARVTAALCLLVSTGCGSKPEPLSVLPPGGRHVLFIGNSLTYVHNLPATVAAIAQLAGDTFRVAMEAGPNLALIDHLKGASNAVQTMRLGGWDYVVLSQGPTPRGICRDSLVLWTKMFEPLIRGVGAKPALYMTWPAVNQHSWFDDVRISFQQAAAAVNGVFLPAGEAWRSAWAEDPNLQLYGGDGFHPSEIGTFLAALEIYERISGRDVRTLPPRAFSDGLPLTLPEATVRLLQQAAHAANAQFPALPAFNAPPQDATTSARAQC